MTSITTIKEMNSRTLNRGIVIPAVPLALTADRKFDDRRQRALLRYYAAAGAGGMAVGVHTTQFAIRDAKHNLFEPVLRLSAAVMNEIDAGLEGTAPSHWYGSAASAVPLPKHFKRRRFCVRRVITPDS